MNEQIEDLLPIYALGGCTPEEREQVEAYIAENPEAEAELAVLTAVVDELAFSVEPITPTPDIEAVLMSRIETEAELYRRAQPQHLVEQPEVKLHSAPPVLQVSDTLHHASRSAQRDQKRPSFPSLWQQLQTWLSTPAVSVGGLALAAILFIWVAVLQGQRASLLEQQQTAVQTSERLVAEVAELADRNDALMAENSQLNTANNTLETRLEVLQEENDSLLTRVSTMAESTSALQAEIETLLEANESISAEYTTLASTSETALNVLQTLQSPTAQTYRIPGNPETQPDAQGQIVFDESSNTAVLLVSGLTPLPAGNVYQVLLIQGSEHETAETFIVDTQGETVLIVNSEHTLGNFDAVGVSIEPEGGSPQRTGEIILLGSIIN